MKFSIWNAAPDGYCLASDAFAGNVGKTLPIRGADGVTVFEAEVTAVEVTDDPPGVTLTFEAKDTPLWVMLDKTGFSLGSVDLD